MKSTLMIVMFLIIIFSHVITITLTSSEETKNKIASRFIVILYRALQPMSVVMSGLILMKLKRKKSKWANMSFSLTKKTLFRICILYSFNQGLFLIHVCKSKEKRKLSFWRVSLYVFL
jgi:hypothetical protein